MNKGMIFTLDATIATSIFIVGVVILYAYMASSPILALSGSGIYTDTNDYLRANDMNGYYSSIFNLYQKGETSGLNSFMDLIVMEAPYNTNLVLYFWNTTTNNFTMFAEKSNYDFGQSMSLRRYVVYGVFRNLTSDIESEIVVNASSFIWGNMTEVNVTIINSGLVDFTNTNITPHVYMYNGSPVSFTTIPTGYTLQNIGAGTNKSYSFNLTMGSTNPIEEYIFSVDVKDEGSLDKNASDPFDIIYLGLVEMKVGV